MSICVNKRIICPTGKIERASGRKVMRTALAALKTGYSDLDSGLGFQKYHFRPTTSSSPVFPDVAAEVGVSMTVTRSSNSLDFGVSLAVNGQRLSA